MTATVFPDHTMGPVKRLHGVNLGPVDRSWTQDYSDRFRAVGIPSVRTHDAPLFVADMVDLHTIFPDPNADPDDPGNYRFELTDEYFASIRRAGAEVYLRLGESIEHAPHKLYIRPRLWTAERLARVCTNIVRHYNDGWANGHEWDLRYVEFWNEPENSWRLDVEQRPCWVGTAKEFYDFYQAVAAALKSHDASLRVGLAGFTGSYVRDWLAVAPDDHDALDGWAGILPSSRRDGVPVDFVSWHTYPASWRDLAALADGLRHRLDTIGLQQAESHLTEWHYMPRLVDDQGPYTFMSARMTSDHTRVERALEQMTNVGAAAFTFGALARMQTAPIDKAHHYTGIGPSWGLFTLSGRPTLLYEGFAAFHELSRDPVARVLRVSLGAGERACTAWDDQVAILATADQSHSVRLGIACLGGDEDILSIKVESGHARTYTVSAARTLTETGWQDAAIRADGPREFSVPSRRPALTLLELTRSQA